MGSIYRRRRRDGSYGSVFCVKYYADGRPVRESTGATTGACQRLEIPVTDSPAKSWDRTNSGLLCRACAPGGS